MFWLTGQKRDSSTSTTSALKIRLSRNCQLDPSIFASVEDFPTTFHASADLLGIRTLQRLDGLLQILGTLLIQKSEVPKKAALTTGGFQSRLAVVVARNGYMEAPPLPLGPIEPFDVTTHQETRWQRRDGECNVSMPPEDLLFFCLVQSDYLTDPEIIRFLIRTPIRSAQIKLPLLADQQNDITWGSLEEALKNSRQSEIAPEQYLRAIEESKRLEREKAAQELQKLEKKIRDQRALGSAPKKPRTTSSYGTQT